MSRRLIILVFFSVLATATLWSQTMQSRKGWLAEADSAYAQKDYYTAFRFYEAALKYDTVDAGVWFKYAESARNFNAYTFAEKGYLKVFETGGGAQFPFARLGLAQVRQKLGKYAEAKTDYLQYLQEQPQTRSIGQSPAEKGLADVEWALQSASSRSLLEPARNLGPEINSFNSDFGAVFRGDSIIYSSFGYYSPAGVRESKGKKGSDPPTIKVLQSVNGSAGQPLGGNYNLPDKNVAYSAFTPDGGGVYFTICERINASDLRCDLYYRKRMGPDQWGEPVKLSVNVPGKTNTQPAVGVESATNQTLLFFVSDRDGGQGQLDLWYGMADPTTGDVKEAINLVALNTPGNDATPFFHQRTQQLYFSTDGRLSLGGYDVYRAARTGDGWAEPKRVGQGVNSSFDDVYYALNQEGTKGLLSSNRWGSTYIEPSKEACCYDIYEVTLNPKVVLDVFTFDAQDSSDLAGTTVKLYEITPDGREVLVATETNPSGNNYQFSLDRHKKYRVVAEKDGYTKSEATVDLTDLDEDVDRVRQDLYLSPDKIKLQALTFDAADMSPLKGARVQLFEVVNGDTVLVGDMINELGNDFNFSIGVNRSYVIKASRPGYDSLTVPLNITPETVKKFGRQITVELPLDRIDFTPQELPIALYFDNGSPDRTSYLPTTQTEYGELNRIYYSKKQEFIDRFTEGLNPEQRFITAQTYEAFFEREVKNGYQNLVDFSEQLIRFLGKGNSIVIELQGYASPRANAEYNQLISQRRIMSVTNFFKRYKNGVLVPYLNNKQFQIVPRAFGESRADRGVPDRLDDIKGSVYSMRASIERRVEIVKVKTTVAQQQ